MCSITIKEIRFFSNGYSSEPLFPSQGLAQGCGLSPLLFIIVMDRPSEVLSKNQKIKGITYNGYEKKCAMAADDTVLSVQGTQEGVDELGSLLEAFHEESGLKVNLSKSVILRIGLWKDSSEQLNSDHNFVWAEPGIPVQYLGVGVSPSFTPAMIDAQFDMDHVRITQILQKCRYQSYSTIGRVLLLKMLIASRLVYKFLYLPSPSPALIKWLTTCTLNTYGAMAGIGWHKLQYNNPWTKEV